MSKSISDEKIQDDGTITEEQIYYFDFDGAGRPTLYLVDKNKMSIREAVDKTVKFYKKVHNDAKKKYYNSGWVAGNRVKPEKFAYFAKQLEDSASKLRHMESELIKEVSDE